MLGRLFRMNSGKPAVAVYDTKPYDRGYLARAAGAGELDWHFHDFRLEAETAAAATGAQAVCVFVNDVVNHEVLERLAGSGVRLVALRCAGFNNVDLGAAKELGIAITRVPSYSPHAVAEHTIALILALNRKIHRAYNRVREMNFSLSGLVGFDLYGKTAGVLGTGKTGRIVAEILRGFGMRVLAFDLFPNREWAAQHGIEYVEPRTLASESDLITLHTPLTPETDHLVNKDTLALTKPGVMLINVSRGRLIDTTALIEALKSRHLGGVALDVYEEEEGIFFEDLSGEVLHDDELARLLTFPNVLVTAHQAFLTHEALSEIARITVENVLRFVGKQPLLEGTVL
jgi:D-lactate dehydrogenase